MEKIPPILGTKIAFPFFCIHSLISRSRDFYLFLSNFNLGTRLKKFYPSASEGSKGDYLSQAQKNFTHPYTEYPWVSVTLSLTEKRKVEEDAAKVLCFMASNGLCANANKTFFSKNDPYIN